MRPWSDECPCGREHGTRQPSRMKARTCEKCDQIGHPTVAVGRFTPGGPDGFRALDSGPLRATRQEAEADVCASRSTSEGSH